MREVVAFRNDRPKCRTWWERHSPEVASSGHSSAGHSAPAPGSKTASGAKTHGDVCQLVVEMSAAVAPLGWPKTCAHLGLAGSSRVPYAGTQCRRIGRSHFGMEGRVAPKGPGGPSHDCIPLTVPMIFIDVIPSATVLR